MSVVIVVKVSEGLVLAADSAATLTGTIEGPEGITSEGVLKTFYNAKKLLQIGNFPIGILTWGNAFVGHRTVESIVRQWEHGNHWQTIEIFREHKKGEQKYKVSECAKGLLKHFNEIYKEEYKNIDSSQIPQIGIIVAGYSEGKFFPEIWRLIIPIDEEIKDQRPDKNGKPNFGASWFGLTEPIVRLHFGRDETALKIISEKFGIDEKEIRDILLPLQYQIPFAQMPLQDAIQYANYMINVVIGRYQFVLGAPLCGGEVEIAAITQRNFNWISKKSWKI